ncbi:hypothetical protein Tco_0997420 [Tanacetum coccineum]
MTLLIYEKSKLGCLPRSAFFLLTSLVARLKVTRPYVTSPSSSIPPSILTGVGRLFSKLLLLYWLNFISFSRWSLILSSHSSTSLFTVMIGVIGSMLFLTPLSIIQEELDILWKLSLLFPDLRVMVPVSNLIVALAVVKNGVPKMKGLFSFSLISKITKSMGNTCSAISTNTSSAIPKGVGHNVHIEPLIDEGVHVLKAPYAASSIHCLGLPYWHFYFGRHFSVVGCLVRHVILFFFISCKGDRVYFLGDGEFGFFPYQYFLRGSVGREFLEKPEHFSHLTVDFLALPEDGVLKYFHSFAHSTALRRAHQAALSPEASSPSTSSSSSSDSTSHALESSFTTSLQGTQISPEDHTYHSSEAVRSPSGPLTPKRPQCSDYATPTSSSSNGPSRKRSQSLATSILSTVHTVGALSPAQANLLPSHKRYRGTSAAHSYESNDESSPETHAESDMDSDIRADIEAEIMAAATIATMTVDGLGIKLVMAGVEMGFEPGLAVVESESKPKEVEADDEDRDWGQTDQQARNLIVDDERSILLEHVVALECSNTILQDALGIERVRADSLQRRLSYVEDELRRVRELRAHEG